MAFSRAFFSILLGSFFAAFFFVSSVSAATLSVSVSSASTGSGTIVSTGCNGANLACGAGGTTCQCDVTPNATVNLIASPAEGSMFGGWSGACPASSGTACSLTMTASGLTASATFVASTFPLSVSMGGAGSGTVTSTPSAINCGSSCSGNFSANTEVTLNAVPNASSAFVIWSGVSCKGGDNKGASCTVVMDGAKSVTANFEIGHKLTVSKSGNGTVTSSPSGIDCGTICSLVFPGANPSVTLTAKPDSGTSFTKWDNGASSCGTNTTCTLSLGADTAVSAVFGEAASSCSGKDSSGTTQSGTCSTTSTCSSGTALTGATGCTGSVACCYAAATEKCVDDYGGTCEMVTSCLGTPLGQFDCSTGQTCCKTQVDPSTAPRCLSENAGIVPCGRSCDDPSTGDVDESAVCTLCHLFLLMKNITSWIFTVMTYIAFAVLVAMGILYIVSAGNTQMISVAKSGIKAALYGFAIVLLGWVAINVILMVLADGALGTDTASFSFKTKGSWFTYSCDTKSKYVRTGVNGATGGTGSTGGGDGGGTVTCGTGACANDAAVKAAVQNQTFMPANDYMAILQAGEHYGQTSTCSKASSPTGACGVSQTMPSNYKTLCGFSTCEAMKADVNKDIACGAKVAAGFKSSHNVRCVDDSSKRIDCTIDGLKSLAGCYNRGYHCNISPRNVSGKWYDCGEIQSGKSYCDRVSEYASSCK